MEKTTLNTLLHSNVNTLDDSLREEIQMAFSVVLERLIHDTHNISNLLDNADNNLGNIFSKLFPQEIRKLVILPCSVIVERNIQIFKSYFEEIILVDNFKAGKTCGDIQVINQEMFKDQQTNDIDAFFVATSNKEILDKFKDSIPVQKTVFYSDFAKEVINNLDINITLPDLDENNHRLCITPEDDKETILKKITVYIELLIKEKIIETRIKKELPTEDLLIDQAMVRSSIGEYKLAQNSIDKALAIAGGKGWRVLKQVVFFLTYRCNYHCSHCWNHKYIKKSIFQTSEMGLTDIVNMFEKSNVLGKVQIIFTGGEIFLRDDIIALLTALSEMGVAFRILTNGSFPEKIRQLLSNETVRRHIGSIHFSLDGDRMIHDAIRKPGSFDKLCQSIKIVQEHGVSFSAGTVIQEQNHHALAKISSVASDLGIHNHGYQLEMKGRRYLKLEPMDHVIPFLGESVSIPSIVGEDLFSGDGCLAGITKCNIRPDGIVEACATASSLLTPFILGDLKDHAWNLDHLLESDQAAQTRARIKTCPGCASFCER